MKHKFFAVHGDRSYITIHSRTLLDRILTFGTVRPLYRTDVSLISREQFLYI